MHHLSAWARPRSGTASRAAASRCYRRSRPARRRRPDLARPASQARRGPLCRAGTRRVVARRAIALRVEHALARALRHGARAARLPRAADRPRHRRHHRTTRRTPRLRAGADHRRYRVARALRRRRELARRTWACSLPTSPVSSGVGVHLALTHHQPVEARNACAATARCSALPTPRCTSPRTAPRGSPRS